MEIEENGKLSFLQVLVYMKPDGLLEHMFYRKPTRTDRYMNKNLNHYPQTKRGIIAERDKRICKPA